jgi:hypothetical protein
MGEQFHARCGGTAGVHTHGTIALLLGAAAYQRSRRAVMSELGRAVAHRGYYYASTEQLTLVRGPPSVVARAFVTARALASPQKATEVASKAVARYSVTPTTIDRVASATFDT